VSEVERPDIVEPENVVDMTMRDQDDVDAVDPRTQGLLAEIDGGVDKDLIAVVFDEY
jgi:hypothetical protein